MPGGCPEVSRRACPVLEVGRRPCGSSHVQEPHLRRPDAQLLSGGLVLLEHLRHPVLVIGPPPELFRRAEVDHAVP
eukprot:1976474-Heterocapsa_arctica.AAC.1